MAYKDDIDKAVAQSNETLRAYQAANPIIPAPRPSEPTGNVGAEFGGPATGESYEGVPTTRFGLGGSIDYGKVFATPAEPTIAADATVPRGSGNAPGETPGPITDAARKAFAPGSPGLSSGPVGPVISVDTKDPTLSVVPGIPDYKNEYAMMKAREAADARDLGVARAAADRANREQSQEYYAAIAAENAMRGVYRPSITEQIVTNASTVATPGGRAGAPPVILPQVNQGQRSVDINGAESRRRDLVEEEIKVQNARSARATSELTQQTEQQKLDQQKRINDIGAKLAAATDQKQRDQLSSTLLALLGKDKPEEYQVIHAPGAETIGPDGFTKLKGPDSIVVLNKRTGALEVMQLGAQPAAGAQDQFVKDQVYTDKNGRKAKYLGDGKWGPA